MGKAKQRPEDHPDFLRREGDLYVYRCAESDPIECDQPEVRRKTPLRRGMIWACGGCKSLW